MKTLTRFLEAEINGKYALEFYRSLGVTVQQSLDWAAYLRNMDFLSMERNELNSLSQLLGAYNPVVQTDGFPTFLTLPDSGTQKFKNMSDLLWHDVEKTEPDINDQATSSDRTGLVEDDAVPQGYIAEGTDAYDDYGNVKPEAVLPSPPSEGAYGEYYGDKYLYLSSEEFVNALLTDSEMREYLEIMQALRNGRPSWRLFKRICDFLEISQGVSVDFKQDSPYPWMIHMTYEISAQQFTNRTKRISLFLYIIANRFPMMIMEDITP